MYVLDQLNFLQGYFYILVKLQEVIFVLGYYIYYIFVIG